jgi:hypothetical protein
VLELADEGCIDGLILDLDEGAVPRDLVLRIYYEERAAPSAAVTIADLFGQTYSDRPIRALPLGREHDGYYLNFPIPFRRHLRLTLENLATKGTAAVELTVRAEVDRRELPDDFVYFHAVWKSDATRTARPYTYLATAGRGHFCGVYSPMQGLANLRYLEGDERIYVDGEGIPSFHGTGTEDYFLGGWYFEDGEFDLPFHGLSHKRQLAGRASPYRFQIVDSIPFRHNIRVEIEHGSWNNYPGATYGSVSFWYQDPPVELVRGATVSPDQLAFPRLRVSDKMSGIDAAQVLDRDFSSPEVQIRMWDALDVEWSGKSQVFLPARGSLALEIPVRVPDTYVIIPFVGRGPDHGIMELALGETRATFDGYARRLAVHEQGPELVADLRPPGARLVSTVTTKHRGSQGFAQGIDSLWIRPLGGPFVTDWLVVGPFDNENDEFFDRPHPPELEFSRNATYGGKDGHAVRWRERAADEDGYVDLLANAGRRSAQWSVSYATTAIFSDRDRPVNILLGSDSGLRVWIGGRLVFRRHRHGRAVPDQYLLQTILQEGWNPVLVKVCNPAGATGFYFRVTGDPALRWDPAALD